MNQDQIISHSISTSGRTKALHAVDAVVCLKCVQIFEGVARLEALDRLVFRHESCELSRNRANEDDTRRALDAWEKCYPEAISISSKRESDVKLLTGRVFDLDTTLDYLETLVIICSVTMQVGVFLATYTWNIVYVVNQQCSVTVEHY